MNKILAQACVLFITACIIISCKKASLNIEKLKPENVVSINNIGNTTGFNLKAANEMGIFQMLNSNGLSPGILNYTNNNNDTINLAEYEGTSYQKWKIAGKGNGFFTIMNFGSGKFLEAAGNNGIVVNAQSNNNAQLWSVAYVSEKAYKVINKELGLAITSVCNGILLATFNGSVSQLWGYNQLPDKQPPAGSFSVDDLLQNNMVIQRDKSTTVRGITDAGITVSVKASWNKNLFSTVADAQGNWKLSVPAAQANTVSQTLTCSVNGPKPVKFSNVLIGDVWICSGQSNMTMPLNKQDDNFGGFHGVIDYENEIAASNYIGIRMLPLRPAASNIPQENFPNPGTWLECNSTNAAKSNFSATGYYFARKIYTSLNQNIPVGVIISAVGATGCERWCSKETINRDPVTQNYYGNRSGVSQLYNAMIYPLKTLSVKGFIWYQGENNTSDIPESNYTLLNTYMIEDWRTLFNQGALPFYFVQLPPLGTLFKPDYLFKNALFREAQANVRGLTKTGMACMMDIDEPYNIHNINKKQVGDRLGLLALANDYNQSLISVGPQLTAYTQTGNIVTITFKNAAGLTDNGTQEPIRFYVASATDKKFLQAKNVQVKGNTIKITVPVSGMKADAVRYAFTDVGITHINNSADLPMEPFRTDNW